MTRLRILLALCLVFITTHLLATPPALPTTDDPSKALAVFWTLEGDVQQKYNKIVEKKLKEIGFNLTDPHKRVNDQYKTKYGSTILDVLSFLPVVNDDVDMPLFNIDPRLAGFAPFNMLIYKELHEQNSHVGHLTPEVMIDILGITDKELKEKFIASFKPLDELLVFLLDIPFNSPEDSQSFIRDIGSRKSGRCCKQFGSHKNEA
jgi:hypothetical protein